MELLPSDTFRFHLNLIALREYVGGTVRVFLNRLYAQWWRDRRQHDITQRHIYKDTQGQKQTRQNWSNRDTTQSRKKRNDLPGILWICLNIVLYQSLDFSVFWNYSVGTINSQPVNENFRRASSASFSSRKTFPCLSFSEHFVSFNKVQQMRMTASHLTLILMQCYCEADT